MNKELYLMIEIVILKLKISSSNLNLTSRLNKYCLHAIQYKKNNIYIDIMQKPIHFSSIFFASLTFKTLTRYLCAQNHCHVSFYC